MVYARMKRVARSVTIAFVAAVAVAAPVTGQPPEAEALYHYYYFNQDYSESVGESEDRCHSYGISRENVLWGTKTSNYHTDIWAYCRNGQLTLH
jgi:hypothetical protein